MKNLIFLVKCSICPFSDTVWQLYTVVPCSVCADEQSTIWASKKHSLGLFIYLFFELINFLKHYLFCLLTITNSISSNLFNYMKTIEPWTITDLSEINLTLWTVLTNCRYRYCRLLICKMFNFFLNFCNFDFVSSSQTLKLCEN